jgi:hypothetical protein
LTWLGILAAGKIDLTTTDLGRHLKNGEILWNEGLKIGQVGTVLNSNFFSYTNAGYPFVNHHWASGVIFFLVHKFAGFAGLSFFHILLTLLTFAVFFHIARRESDFPTAAILSFLLIPLIAERREIRPEVWSVFFSAVFFFLLWKYSRGKMSWKWLLALAPLQIAWVNLHIYFFLGIFLAGCFWFSEIAEVFFRKMSDDEFAGSVKRTKVLTAALVLVVLASLVSPFGLEGFLYPFKILGTSGYTLVENKSVSFVEGYGISNPNFLLVRAVLALAAASFVLLFVVGRRKNVALFLSLAVFFGVFGWMAIRNFTLLGFFALVILAWCIGGIFSLREKKRSLIQENGIAVVYILVFLVAAVGNFQFAGRHFKNFGVGLLPENQKAAEFLKNEKIKGPIFNNYDIGSYLIYNLYPEQKVFVDNRPEAYPDAFFSEVYKPMQEDPAVFEKADREYNFNAVVFARNDITPWGMNFLKTIGENPGWGKVFEDDFAVVYKNSRIEERMNNE